jgi:hypothetical protein
LFSVRVKGVGREIFRLVVAAAAAAMAGELLLLLEAAGIDEFNPFMARLSGDEGAE